MSIKDRVERVKLQKEERDADANKYRDLNTAKAHTFFAPVYKAFLELEKEYGVGRGLKFSVSDVRCIITKDKGRDELEMYSIGVNKDEITIRETRDYSNIPDPEIMEEENKVDTPEEAIEIAITYVGKNIS
jgi:hypothetical protein